METTDTLNTLSGASYAVQCLLQHYAAGLPSEPGAPPQQPHALPGSRAASPTGDEGGELYAELKPDVKLLVKPYLTTK
jgi:hypothetical protein